MKHLPIDHFTRQRAPTLHVRVTLLGAEPARPDRPGSQPNSAARWSTHHHLAAKNRSARRSGVDG